MELILKKEENKAMKKFKENLLGLIKKREVEPSIDLNEEICNSYNVKLYKDDSITLTALYLDELNENQISLECLLEDYLTEESDLNDKLRKQNTCCSFSYGEIDLCGEKYVLPLHALVNRNWSNDYYANFNLIVKKEDLLKNFPAGRKMDIYNSDVSILSEMITRKANLKEDESLNYYVQYIAGDSVEGEVSQYKYPVSAIPRKIASSVVNCKTHVVLKDYDNNIFEIDKSGETSVDFNTIRLRQQ